MKSGHYHAATATISPCGLYRYDLTRVWDAQCPPLVFLMLNPSTADATQLDPTVSRCLRHAQRLGYGGLVVLNLFALRSTNPRALELEEDPIGPENDSALDRWVQDGTNVICAWGAIPGKSRRLVVRQRPVAVLDRLRRLGADTWALHINADGSPKHPLYCRGNADPVEYRP